MLLSDLYQEAAVSVGLRCNNQVLAEPACTHVHPALPFPRDGDIHVVRATGRRHPHQRRIRRCPLGILDGYAAVCEAGDAGFHDEILTALSRRAGWRGWASAVAEDQPVD